MPTSEITRAPLAPAKRKVAITDALLEFVKDPLGFVYYAYPWGKAGTFLENETGPDEWQHDTLEKIRIQLEAGKSVNTAVQIAIRSGQSGVGKTALISWLIQWFISTRVNPQIVVTANTETQLQTKTWRELAKWHQISEVKDLFKWTATRYMQVAQPETWFAAAIPWSEHNAEAFAGTHEHSVMFLIDEGSGVADIIFDNIQASMNAPEAICCVFGNPTKNTGRFHDIFGKLAHRWHTMTVDARTSKRADQKLIKEWIEDYGEDSDFVRIRVKGIPPRAQSNQFIDQDLIDKAGKYKSVGHDIVAKIMGVDVARFGDDKSVLIVRQGRKCFPARKFTKKSNTELGNEIVKAIKEDELDYVIISGVGVGAGVIDYLNTLGYGEFVIEVGEGEAAIDQKYFNKRAEMWGLCRDWLKRGAELPNDDELKEQLKTPLYGFADKTMRIQLESKKSIKQRALSSPDVADALTLTFGMGMDLPKKRHGFEINDQGMVNTGLPKELRDDVDMLDDDTRVW